MFLIMSVTDSEYPVLRAFHNKIKAKTCFDEWSASCGDHHGDLVQMFHIDDNDEMTEIGHTEYIEDDETSMGARRIIHFHTRVFDNL